MAISYSRILLVIFSCLCVVTSSFAQDSKSIPAAYAHLVGVYGVMYDSITFPKESKLIVVVDTSWQIMTKKQVKAASKGRYLTSYYVDSSRIVRLNMMTPPSAARLAALSGAKQQRKDAEKHRKELRGKKAPDFVVTSLQGDVFRKVDLAGKTVVLNFWFVDCPPCRREIPDLNELVEKYRSEDIVFIAIALDKPERLQEFLASTPLLYDVVPNGREYAHLYNVSSYPTNMVIDREGRLSYENSGVGLRSVALLEKAIKKSLK